MGLFDFLKKKEEEPEYDVTNLSIKDLKTGFFIDYDMKSWQIKEEYKYDWGSDNFSSEYKLDSGEEVLFLHIEDRGELRISMTKSIKIRTLGDDIIDKTIKKERPPKKLELDGIQYHLHTDNGGYFNDVSAGSEEWEELMSWEYYDDDEKNLLSITQWGERDFDASAGKMIKEFEISNIIPAGS